MNRSFEKARIQFLLSNNVLIKRKIISKKDLKRRDRNVKGKRSKQYNSGGIDYRKKNSTIRALSMNYRLE